MTEFICSDGSRPAALPVGVCSSASACVFSLLSGRPPTRPTVYVKALSLHWFSHRDSRPSSADLVTAFSPISLSRAHSHWGISLDPYQREASERGGCFISPTLCLAGLFLSSLLSGLSYHVNVITSLFPFSYFFNNISPRVI